MIDFIGRSISSKGCSGKDTESLLNQNLLLRYSTQPDFVKWTYHDNGPTQWVLIANFKDYASPIGFLNKKPDLPYHTGGSYYEVVH